MSWINGIFALTATEMYTDDEKILLKVEEAGIKILEHKTRETDAGRKTALGQLDTPFTINLNVRLKCVNESPK